MWSEKLLTYGKRWEKNPRYFRFIKNAKKSEVVAAGW